MTDERKIADVMFATVESVAKKLSDCEVYLTEQYKVASCEANRSRLCAVREALLELVKVIDDVVTL